MNANRTEGSSELIDELIVRAMTETVEEIGGQEVGGEQVTERALQRYEELTEPLRIGIDSFFANTISTTLLEVGERHVRTGGDQAFSREKVVEESMAKLVRALGPPEDVDGARAGIRAYLYEAHGKKSTAS